MKTPEWESVVIGYVSPVDVIESLHNGKLAQEFPYKRPRSQAPGRNEI